MVCVKCKKEITERNGYYIKITGWLEKMENNGLRSPLNVTRHREYAHAYCVRYSGAKALGI